MKGDTRSLDYGSCGFLGLLHYETLMLSIPCRGHNFDSPEIVQRVVSHFGILFLVLTDVLLKFFLVGFASFLVGLLSRVCLRVVGFRV